jgi:hypothetical protein
VDATATRRQTEEEEAAAAVTSAGSESDTPAMHVVPLAGNGDISDSDGDACSGSTVGSDSASATFVSLSAAAESGETWSVSLRQAEAAFAAARVTVPPHLTSLLVEHWRSQRRANRDGALLRAYQSISLGDHGVGVEGDDSDEDESDEQGISDAGEAPPPHGSTEDAMRGSTEEEAAEATSLAFELRKLKRLRQSLEQARMMVDLTRKRDRFRRDMVRNTAAMRLLMLAGGAVSYAELAGDSPPGKESDRSGSLLLPLEQSRRARDSLPSALGQPPPLAAPRKRLAKSPDRSNLQRESTPQPFTASQRLRQSSISSSMRKAAAAASASAAAEVARRRSAAKANDGVDAAWHSSGRCSVM